jgi:DNA-binding XRE family transcriptional regulator
MTEHEMDVRDRIAARHAYVLGRGLKHLPAMLKAYRAAKGLTMAQAAAQVGVARMTIWRLENGKDVRMHLLVAVLDWMGRRA